MEQENLQINFTKLKVYNNLDEIEKSKLKIFVPLLFKLARESKKLIETIPNLDKEQLPILNFIDKNDNHYIIEYSININKWLMIINEQKPIIYNPIISEIINLLSNIQIEEINNCLKEFNDNKII